MENIYHLVLSDLLNLRKCWISGFGSQHSIDKSLSTKYQVLKPYTWVLALDTQ
jgi:hypothetical protein